MKVIQAKKILVRYDCGINRDSMNEDDILSSQEDGPSRYNLKSVRNRNYSKHIGKVDDTNEQ